MDARGAAAAHSYALGLRFRAEHSDAQPARLQSSTQKHIRLSRTPLAMQQLAACCAQPCPGAAQIAGLRRCCW